MPRTIAFESKDPNVRKEAETIAFGGPIPDDDYANLIGDIAEDAEVTVQLFTDFSKRPNKVPVTIRAKCSTHNAVAARRKRWRTPYVDR
jgi:hypothetical protein